MNLVRFYNPRYAANKVLVDELFNNFFRNDYHEDYVKSCNVKPASNVFETDKEFKIEVLLPGFKKEDVQLNFKDNLLTIKTETKEKAESNPEEYKFSHREFGSYDFEKQFSIPKTVDGENISARFENGILTISLPKKEEALEKEAVEIKIS